MTDDFFAEAREQSKVKTALVEKYFAAWSKIISNQVKKFGKKLAYVDLFAGPGRFNDGTPSTPIRILERAIASPDLREMLVTKFNDENPQFVELLSQHIKAIPGVGSLRHEPTITNVQVGHQIAEDLKSIHLVPTLFFVDPWGYKGLSLDLIWSMIKDWACECIFFFNYSRINMGLANPVFRNHIDVIFGQDRADRLRACVSTLSPAERESSVVQEIGEALVALGAPFVLPFRFRSPETNRISHHLVFVSKNVLGYTIMKDIMAAESAARSGGIASFEYNEALGGQGLLFGYAQRVEELGDLILEKYAGQTISMEQVFQQHHIGTPFVKKNYKDALLVLEVQDRVQVDPPVHSRMKKMGKPTFGDQVRVTFPPKGGS
ncbi:MAG: three-Cys-motif partner protein TcmP [Candidatus Riflebacteria bacterium]|nr:three-Cys-motif partner protein TcmP [Candidatus Riflebacteria bacterium]